MISASCPSCGSPITFAHASAVSVVCEACRSQVIRDDMDTLVAAGKLSAFERDLSPIQLGVRGRLAANDRCFEVVGVLRKARKAVRWNEWYLSFDDGTSGWLGEGHGSFQLYDQPPIPCPDILLSQQKPGDNPVVDGRTWRVIEVAKATVVAADGQLPFAALDGVAWTYADLRAPGGDALGTLDATDGKTEAWLGRVVSLTELELEGLRPITGWSDPVLSGFAGPDVSPKRTLACPNCGGDIALRAPGRSAHIGCEYCGSQVALTEAAGVIGGRVLKASEKCTFSPTLALGRRAKFGGLDWEVIGAMERYVRFDGVRYSWEEYFLYNPYRGVRFLSQSNGHWTIFERLVNVPHFSRQRNRSAGVAHMGLAYRHFQGAKAIVSEVLGEFDWEVRAGDSAKTNDYVSPPMMLSLEEDAQEINWSLGRYLTPEEIRTAFGAKLPQAFGVAPNQPNPYRQRKHMVAAGLSTAALCLLAIAITILPFMLTESDTLLIQSWSVTPSSEHVVISDTFEIAKTGVKSLQLDLKSSIPRSQMQVHIALLNETDGTALFPLKNSSATQTVKFRGMTPGAHRLRVEMAWAPTKPARNRPATGTVYTKLKTNPVRVGPVGTLFLYALLAPIMLFLLGGSFEARRWAESDHAP